MGRYRRSPGRRVSRREVLASGLLVGGGALVAADSGAFSQTVARRGTTVATAGDSNALLGLDVAPLIKAGASGQHLVDVTNNADRTLSVSVAIADARSGESVSPATVDLAPGDTQTVTATVSADRPGGVDALAFDVTATDGDALTIDLTRATTIPTLDYRIFDETQNSNVQFDVQYQVEDVPDFDRITIDVRNTNPDRSLSESFTETDPEGVVSYPSSGSDGGAAGDTYEFAFEAFDGSHGSVLERTITKTANGQDQGEGDFGGADDPTLEWFYVVDDSTGQDGAAYTVYYRVSNTDRFAEAEVTFDTVSWATESTTNANAPIGEVTYGPVGGADGNDYEIQVEVRSDSGVVVDSGTRSDTADGDDPSNPDIAVDDSPQLSSVDVSDETTDGGHTNYTLAYDLTTTTRFEEVRVTFENVDNGWATKSYTSTDAPSGTVSYDPEWTGGDTYEITTEVYERREGVVLPVDETTVTDVADGNDP